ncbi:arginine decarboxylase [Arboricoccus pini]|uniref:Arginine decarboxylase n=1 Tax=Arboricoccus pini TaxID=1963835 RepID=A0A212RG66_9PROT|nr:Orn/Lys/Arg decarboxylase N-terminal domain-containing protein [Arboricoccus pini]SNB71337.1 arginine decarboxylase [Arboricoccus pini]
MLGKITAEQEFRVLIIDEKLAQPASYGGRAIRALAEELRRQGIGVIEALSYEDGQAAFMADASLDAILIDWTSGDVDNEAVEHAADALLRTIRRRNAYIPIILLADREATETLDVDIMLKADEYVFTLEDTTSFIAGRVLAAIKRYTANLLPPFNKALFAYLETAEYSWAAPGHQGGIAFTKSPAGRVFYDFFGENLFRTDSGIERGSLGSLLDHSGPIGEGEEYAARIFGAHRSYSGLTGTSGSNRAIMGSVIGENRFAICDRNCHKSIEQGLILAGGVPLFLVPTRNHYGIIGPILPDQLDPGRIRERLEAHPLRGHAKSLRPTYAVLTNSTYDGICYDASRAQDLLDKSTDTIHFDEAWFAYARFHPLYVNRFAMRGSPEDHPANGPTVFATHSTHKLLAALSQASYIHVREGRRRVEHSVFNESYMAQQTTSPLYALLASNEIGAAMMDGPGGRSLTDDVIRESIAFRQALARAHREYAQRGDWFFWPWNAPAILDRETGGSVPFADADPVILARDPAAWILGKDEAWHGFGDIPDGWAMLDPIKVGIVCPGIDDAGEMLERGIPAAVLNAYLHHNGIIPSRTTDFMILCLFSMGVTKGKWGTLISVLLDFKQDYDENRRLVECLPNLVAVDRRKYGRLGLKDLADMMFEQMKVSRMEQWQAKAFGTLPIPVMPPRLAAGLLNEGEAELLPLDQLTDRVAGVGIIPYPPGIPIIMPGESFGPADGPWLSYMRALQDWRIAFPGFGKEVEGSVVKDDVYHVWCLKQRP